MAVCSRSILVSAISSILLILTASDALHFSRNLSPSELGISPGRERLTHLHFYFHDIVSGGNATAVRVAGAPASGRSLVGFGTVFVIDDPLTVGPERGSRLVGRAQGMYGQAGLEELGLMMVVNFVLEEGEYRGSCLSLLGRNNVLSELREMPIVGGSGLFRFARGYAQARTHRITPEEAIVEYNVYVYYY